MELLCPFVVVGLVILAALVLAGGISLLGVPARNRAEEVAEEIRRTGWETRQAQREASRNYLREVRKLSRR